MMDSTPLTEVNMDGLVGPTHHYGGLSFGNRASMQHGHQPSNPKAAALQGLRKMKALADRGYAQAVLPPLFRPNRDLLQRLGFRGSIDEQLRACSWQCPELFSAVWSASSMWTANAATVFPSPDTADGRLRFVPANLASQFHRSLEAADTRRLLQAVFADKSAFAVEAPLPAHPTLGDEGAANHTRLSTPRGKAVHFFVFGADSQTDPQSLHFPARQSRTASMAVARLGQLGRATAVFARQSPEAINAGVFHNDVIAVGTGNCLFCHQQAFADQEAVLTELRSAFRQQGNGELTVLEVPADRVSLKEAVQSYLFNSQLLDHPGGGHCLVVPAECREHPRVAAYLDEVIADPRSPLRELLVFDLRQSMHNGGGPACLRLRVAMTPAERKQVRGRIFLDEALYADLAAWVSRHYPDSLTLHDLARPDYFHSCLQAFRELGDLLQLPGLYPSSENRRLSK